MATDLHLARCEACMGIVRYDPRRSAWTHSDHLQGADHAPELPERPYSVPSSALYDGLERPTTADREELRGMICESELRLLDGNR